jgi:ornithine decarboxylase
MIHKLSNYTIFWSMQKTLSFFTNATRRALTTCTSNTATRTLYDNIVLDKRQERAFYINDLSIVQKQVHRWKSQLPSVRIFYAVKCSPDPVLLKLLACNNTGFDCASRHEMEIVLSLTRPENIIFANPIKSIADILFAKKHGVKKLTFDNVEELKKIKIHYPEAELIIRLLVNDSGSTMPFGKKFGVPFEHVESLLGTCKSYKLNVIGTSFHIGSGCFDANLYADAISLSKKVHDMASQMGLASFTFLDLGGGFPGHDNKMSVFNDMAKVINASLLKHFPMTKNLHIIAEPGRYMATSWSTLFTLIQGKRSVSPNKLLYYINDGVYGSFNCIKFDHALPIPIPAATATATTKQVTIEKIASTIFGVTCDSADVIVTDYMIEDMQVGDWLKFEEFGAYTLAASSTFNGVPLPDVYYIPNTVSICP